ncbi:MAG: glycosyltransferase [Thermodesulfobacteriota bacterium]
MKVALIHDWLTGMRGGERVLEAFCEVFPEADIFTLLYNPGSVSGVIENRSITTSFIQRLPLSKKHYPLYLPLFPMAVERFDLFGYDLVISLSHCVAKGVITSHDSVHISYIFTPMRYIWDRFHDYFGDRGSSRLKLALYSLAAHYLRVWDVASAKRVDSYIAISDYVARRVEKYYSREAAVLYPPVDCERFSLSKTGPEDYYLIVSAFVPYKRLDIAVEAFNKLGGRLVIVGGGREEKKLKALAGPNIEFLGQVSDARVASLYRNCRALIFPGVEDFGITPLEAMASGRPVIAFAEGGVLETLCPLFKKRGLSTQNKAPTGLFFYEQTPAAIIKAVNDFELHEKHFSPLAARERAERFSLETFKKNIKKMINEEYENILRKREKCSKNTPKSLRISSF